MNHIKIEFYNYKFKRFPKVRIYVNSDLMEEIHFHDAHQSVCFPIDLANGQHKIEIEHFDKTSADTKMVNGTISSDTKFTIKSISIDNFDLPASLLRTCNFKPDWKNLSKPKNFPEILTQSFTIGPNGIWTLFFETPVENWLMRDWKIKQEKIRDTITYESYEISAHSTTHYKFDKKQKQLITEIKSLLNG